MKKTKMLLLLVPALLLVSCGKSNPSPVEESSKSGEKVTFASNFAKLQATAKKLDSTDGVGFKIENGKVEVEEAITSNTTSDPTATPVMTTITNNINATDLDLEMLVTGLTATDPKSIKGSVELGLAGTAQVQQYNSETKKVVGETRNLDSTFSAYYEQSNIYLDFSKASNLMNLFSPVAPSTGEETSDSTSDSSSVTTPTKFYIAAAVDSEDLPLFKTNTIDDMITEMVKDIDAQTLAALETFADCRLYDDGSYSIELGITGTQMVAMTIATMGITPETEGYTEIVAQLTASYAPLKEVKVGFVFDDNLITEISFVADVEKMDMSGLAGMLPGSGESTPEAQEITEDTSVITLDIDVTVNLLYGNQVSPKSVGADASNYTLIQFGPSQSE